MNMEKISIICLIYQSKQYAECVFNNIQKYTPELETGEAEFYFIANDPTVELRVFLERNSYPFYINNNPSLTEYELFEHGFAYPEYMSRVYKGYNYGIEISGNPIVMTISSDNCFSPDWLKNLKKRLTLQNIVSPKIIQPSWFRNPINGTECEIMPFGNGWESYYEEGFIGRVKIESSDSVSVGNALMPFMCYKSNIEKVGYYPEGNLHNGNYQTMLRTGDTELFLKLAYIGVRHIQSNDSIVYHFNEGEKYLKK